MKSIISIRTFLVKFWHSVLNVGVKDDLPFEERKVTIIINALVITGIPFSFFFLILNFFQHRYPLSAINFITLLGGLSIVFIHKRRNYIAGRIVLCTLSMLIFFISSLIYSNGVEFFLLLNIVATTILFKSKKYVAIVSSLNAVLFLIVVMLHNNGVVYFSVPANRYYLNVAWALIFMIAALFHFKKQHIRHQEQVEETNQQLLLQQHLLLSQKKELEKKSEELSALNETKEKLFSIIAHDMKSPIGTLKGLLDLYKNGYVSEQEIKSLSDQISRNVGTLYENLDNLLHWSHSQLNGISPTFKLFELKTLVEETLQLNREIADGKQLIIINLIPDKLLVDADSNHIAIVFRNIINNAVKYSYPGGQIIIEAIRANERVKVSITDFGLGINQSQLQNLFVFGKPSTLGTSNEKGTGLGLALSKEFIEKNKGEIWVTSEPGKGSVFSFYLNGIKKPGLVDRVVISEA